MYCSFLFFVWRTYFCYEIILMDKISLMPTFNNHLQCFQTKNGELSRIKIDENNYSREQIFLQNALSRKNWDFLNSPFDSRDLVLEANFYSPGYVMLLVWFDDQSIGPLFSLLRNRFCESTSTRTLRAASRIFSCF